MPGSRLARLQQMVREKRLDALLITSLPNIRYLTGFSGSHGLCLVRKETAVFLTDQRYAIQSKAQVRGCRRIIARMPLFETGAHLGLLRGCRRVGFESRHLSYAQHRMLRRLFSGVSFRPTENMVEDLAMVKDRREIRTIQDAARIADATFLQILGLLRPGLRETDIAAEISYHLRCSGAERDAFEPIVASGPRGALPHGRPTARRLRRGEFVTLDFGCTVNGYSSDLTRTVALGRPTHRMRDLYAAVLDAHAEAVAAARPGMYARDLDAIARTRLRKAGYARYFVHSLGHGLGLHLHERPRVSPLSSDVLAQGHVITIEPGVYVPGECGVRIEDDVLITSRGCRVLTRAPKELMSI